MVREVGCTHMCGRCLAHLSWEGVSGVCVGGVQEHAVCVPEARQVRVVQQPGAVAHVAAVDVAPAVWQLKQQLGGARAVVGVDKGHLDAWRVVVCTEGGHRRHSRGCWGGSTARPHSHRVAWVGLCAACVLQARECTGAIHPPAAARAWTRLAARPRNGVAGVVWCGVAHPAQ